MALSAKQARMLDILSRRAAWATAADLADALGVTSRSIRSYAAALGPLIESGPSGYRLRPDAYAAYLEDAQPVDEEAESPRGRMSAIARQLLEQGDGIDVYETADRLFVSDSTIESDLTRLRGLLADSELHLEREGSVVRLTGPEAARRHLLGRLFREEVRQTVLDLGRIEEGFGLDGLAEFKADLVEMLDADGFFVNEYGINDVLLHVAIALDRTAKARALPVGEPDDAAAPLGALAAGIGGLAARHFGVELDPAELAHLAALLRSRVLAPGAGGRAASEYASDDDLRSVAEIVARASREYLIDLRDEEFIARLTLHVQNLVARAHLGSLSRNPLTRSIKTTYPMVYELAVYISSRLRSTRGIEVNDDEIAYIAMHVGAYLEQQARRRDAVTCAVISPNYYDMHVLLRQRLEGVFGDELDVTTVIGSTDVDWDALDVEVIVTTIEPPVRREGMVVVQPFLVEADIDRIHQAVARVRRHRRRARLTNELLEYFDERLFFRNFHARDPYAMIQAIGDRMIAVGAVDQAYIDQTIQREQLSSTAFTESLAVPHAMTMTANRTTIAIVVNDVAMEWGEARVNVIALIAFSAAGRASFQAVFDQFVEVFNDREAVLGLIRRTETFGDLIDELVRIIDA